MGDISDFLFGEKPETSQLPSMTGGQQNVLAALTSLLTGKIGQGGPRYTGELAAGASPIQKLAFGNVLDLMGQGEEYGGTLQSILRGAEEKGGPAYETGMGSIMRMLEPYKAEDTVGTWQKYVAPEATRMFEESLSPMVEKFVAKGATSSSGFNRALAKAASDMASQMGMGLGSQIFAEKGAWEGRQPQATSQALGYYAAPFEMGQQGFGQMLDVAGLQQNLANLGMQTGGVERGITQDILSGAFQKWQMAQPYANPWLQYLGTALGVQPYQYAQTGGTPGLLGSMGGAAGGSFGETMGSGGAVALLSMLSDRRLKKNIKFIKSVGPIRFYRFRYIWETAPIIRIGVMAQELRKIWPDLVRSIGSYLAVDYYGLWRRLWPSIQN